MTDHFGKEILFLVVSISFIVLLLTDVTVSFSETRFDMNELNEETTFDSSWESTGDNFKNLETLMPLEFFTLFILPLIILVGYIVLKTASGILPNWLSGG
jgi:hypothetical protein